MTQTRGVWVDDAATVPAPETSYFDRVDLVAILILTVVAFVLRFFSPILPDFFLHPLQGPWITNCVSSTPINAPGDLGTLCGLAYPYNRGYEDANGMLSPAHGEIFDEIWFADFAHDDLKRVSYFDPEPPLGKELIAAGMWSYGWWRVHFDGASGNYADLGFNTFGMRIAACIFGTLCIPLMYLFARRLWSNRLFAFAAAALACFDGMFFIQSRIGMIDIFAIFFVLAAYYLFLVHVQSRSSNTTVLSLLALGLVLGLGVAAKWFVLAAWASIVFFLLVRVGLRGVGAEWGPLRWLFPTPGIFWARYATVGVLALVVIPAAIYMESWLPFFQRGQFHDWTDLVAYQLDAIRYHRTLTATHPYGSPAWSWPFLARPVLYYAEYQSSGGGPGIGFDTFTGQPLWARISNLGNPWIWWTSLPCLAAMPYFIVRHRSFPATLILIGFVTQYVPWVQVTRVLFLYHMFGGLIFMVLALAFVLAYLADKLPSPNREALVAFHLAVAVFAFGYFYPVWTATPISVSAWYPTAGTPIWGPKLWLLHCQNLPPSKPEIFCWN